MARLARLVVPGLPHHVTQRGNGRQKVFFSDEDYALYRSLLAESCKAAGVACWAYVLMPSQPYAFFLTTCLFFVTSVAGSSRRCMWTMK